MRKVSEVVQTNEAFLIMSDLEDGVSLGGAMMTIRLGARREAAYLRMDMGDEAFIAAIKALADTFNVEL